MLDELAPQLRPATAKDLLARLNHRKDVSQVLPAEFELAYRFALNRSFQCEHEPEWWADGNRPDVFAHDFLPGTPAAIEITAPSDNSISAEAAMDSIAQKICKIANAASKGLAEYLYFVFGETSGYADGKYFRRVLAPQDYEPTGDVVARIENWASAGANGTLSIVGDNLALSVTKKSYKQVRFHNCHSSMPPEAHSLLDNPLYELLDRKRRQIRSAPAGALRILLLGDAGSRLLNRLGQGGEFDPTRRSVSGREIISRFVLDHADGVDAVVVVVPKRGEVMWQERQSFWKVSCFVPGVSGAFLDAPIKKFVSELPRPRFEGYQARSLFRQGLFSHTARGWYLGRTITTGNTMQITVSARGLLDFLAGRINEKQFRALVIEDSDNANIFLHWLKLGYTISNVEMLPRQPDQEDDHILLHFSDDPAARLLRLPQPKAPGSD